MARPLKGAGHFCCLQAVLRRSIRTFREKRALYVRIGQSQRTLRNWRCSRIPTQFFMVNAAAQGGGTTLENDNDSRSFRD